jgi:hypothetical protein
VLESNLSPDGLNSRVSRLLPYLTGGNRPLSKIV